VSTVLSPRAYAVRCPLRAGEQLVDHEMLFAVSGVYWNKFCHQSITREKTGDINWILRKDGGNQDNE